MSGRPPLEERERTLRVSLTGLLLDRPSAAPATAHRSSASSARTAWAPTPPPREPGTLAPFGLRGPSVGPGRLEPPRVERVRERGSWDPSVREPILTRRGGPTGAATAVLILALDEASLVLGGGRPGERHGL